MKIRVPSKMRFPCIWDIRLLVFLLCLTLIFFIILGRISARRISLLSFLVLVACYGDICLFLFCFILFYFILFFFFLLRRDKGCILVAVCNQPAWWNVDPGKVIKYVTKTRSLDKSCKQRKRDVPLMLNGISGFIWTIYTFYVVFFPLSLSLSFFHAFQKHDI